MASSSSAKRILAVDDDPVILKALSLTLGPKGYDVLTALEAPEAFGIVRRNKPDLILLDIFFPPDAGQSGNSWDGFRIIEWLHRMCGPEAASIPIIVISGAEPEKFKERCLAAGVRAYFQKPIMTPDLLNAIQQVFLPAVSGDSLKLAAMADAERVRATKPPSMPIPVSRTPEPTAQPAPEVYL